MPKKKFRTPRLLPKQKKFAQLVASGVMPTHAARQAGYGEKRAADTAWRLLNDDDVKEVIMAYRIVHSHAFAAEAGLFWDALMETMLSNDPKTKVQAIRMMGEALHAFDKKEQGALPASSEPFKIALTGEEEDEDVIDQG